MPYLGKSPSQGVRNRYYYTVSASATSVSGSDDNSNTLIFADGEYVDVYLNGVLLVAGTDYNTSTANQISSISSMSANDIVEVIVYDTFSVFSGNVNSNFTVGGNIDIDGTANLDIVDIDGAVDMASTLTVAGVVDITDTTDSSDATGDTGALRTEGGASIAKKLYVGTDLDVDGTTNLDVVDIDGAVDMASTLQVDGAITSNGLLTVDGSANSSQAIFTGTSGRGLEISTFSVGAADEGVKLDATASGSTGQIALATNGTNRVTINGNGSVGIGVADGDVTSDGTAARTYVGIIGTGNRGRLNLGSTAVNGADSGVLSFVNGANELGNINMETNSGSQTVGKMYISSTDLLTINSAGGVVVNDNSANVDFRVESNSKTHMLFVDASTDAIGINNSSPSSYPSGTQTGTATDGGQFRIGGSVGAVCASDTGNELAFTRSGLNYISSPNGGFNIRAGTSGGVSLASGGTSWGSASDERLKTLTGDIENAIDKVKTLRTKMGRYNDESQKISHPFLIAQDVQAVLPEAVSVIENDPNVEDKTGVTDKLYLNYTDVIPLLTAALKESIAKNEALEARVAALES